MIDECLASVGEYGEVHLIVQNGELRYIIRLKVIKRGQQVKEVTNR